MPLDHPCPHISHLQPHTIPKRNPVSSNTRVTPILSLITSQCAYVNHLQLNNTHTNPSLPGEMPTMKPTP